MNDKNKIRKTIDFKKSLVAEVDKANLPEGINEFVHTFTAKLHYLVMRGLTTLKK